MEQLPILIDLKGRRVVVVGGGELASRRVDLLAKAGAAVTVVADAPGADMERMIADGLAVHSTDALTPATLKDCALAFGASHDAAQNETLHRLATAAGIPVNVADRSDLCSFIMPAVVDRAPVIIAVSSGSKAPIVARILKARLESLIPAAYGRVADFAGSWRERVAERLSDPARRLHFWEEMTDGPIPEALLAGNEDTAERLMAQSLDDAVSDSATAAAGEVYLVGAGPGDPDLLTFRALRLMQQAEIVLYDRLIGDGILNLVRRDAERIYVGKLPKEHTMPQGDISGLLVKLAREGRRVLRLKGGDPFIFGRGGEEIEALAREGIAFQVVPGVTAASGCASYAGIPLTHRDHAQSCIFVTGHGKDGKLNLNWPALVQPGQTVVVYMGLGALEQLTAEYAANGGDPEMPAAVVEGGTMGRQRVVSATVATLAEAAREAEIGHPALIIIGTVVTLRSDLAWYASDEEAVPATTKIIPGALRKPSK